MKVVIDLEKVFAVAMQHMESPDDLRWSVGMALQELYWDKWAKDFQERMIYAYPQGESK
jgi:hypothetical protein